MNIETLLRTAQRPLLIAHIAPDGDAIGSLLGLGWALKDVGKQPIMACADPVPEELRFLPGTQEIIAQVPDNEDLIVCLDSADLERLGPLYDEARFARHRVINIDHHVTNTRFGDAHLIEPVASTAQVVYGLLQQLGWPLNPWTATCLLTGLITDTRSFRTSNTDAEALRVALALVEAGAPLAEINGQLNRDLSLRILTLWGRALSSLQCRDGIAWAEVSQKALRACGLSSTDTAGLVNLIASAREVQIAFVLVENAEGCIEVGFRSVPGVDVSRVALALGGGGHPQAAGCTLPGPMEKAREAVLQSLALAFSPLRPTLVSSLEDSDAPSSVSVSSD